MEIPKRLYEEAVKRGIDVEDLVIQTLIEKLQLDPKDSAKARLELAERLLAEAREYVEKNDVVQASEKLYKAAEECVKALAEAYNAPQLGEVKKRGRGDTWLLGMAATDLSKMLNEDRIRLAWKDAYDIHVWGFHEAKYRIDDVKAALPLVEWLVEYTKRKLGEAPQ
ncbi:MAG: PaREP1 family protein [Thermofilaceae archaeon]